MTVSSTSVQADTDQLHGHTLLCTNIEDPAHAWYRPVRLYVSKERVFLVAGDGTNAASGTIYEFGKTRSETVGVNPYKSTATLGQTSIDLQCTITVRDCNICSGKIIMITNKHRIFWQNNGWFIKYEFRQWFPDGTRAAAPYGSSLYTCNVLPGRVNVGQ